MVLPAAAVHLVLKPILLVVMQAQTPVAVAVAVRIIVLTTRAEKVDQELLFLGIQIPSL
jgi:hypothetical protein